MPEAADRIRVEPKSPPKRARTPPSPRWSRAVRALAPKSRRGYAGAALVALMIGIVVNALALQHGRRIDLPPDVATTASMPQPAAPLLKPAVTAAPSAPSVTMAPAPPVRSASASPAPQRVQKSADPIADLLRSNGGENKRLVGAAQQALAKLGFAVKATGSIDAETRSAMVEFEKSRRMPVSTEVTAKLVKTLNAAVAAN